jgi:hypothetical protein
MYFDNIYIYLMLFKWVVDLYLIYDLLYNFLCMFSSIVRKIFWNFYGITFSTNSYKQHSIYNKKKKFCNSTRPIFNSTALNLFLVFCVRLLELKEKTLKRAKNPPCFYK